MSTENFIMIDQEITKLERRGGGGGGGYKIAHRVKRDIVNNSKIYNKKTVDLNCVKQCWYPDT